MGVTFKELGSHCNQVSGCTKLGNGISGRQGITKEQVDTLQSNWLQSKKLRSLQITSNH